MTRWITYYFRWLRWAFTYPDIVKLNEDGLDHDSRHIIYDRHDALEPQPPTKPCD